MAETFEHRVVESSLLQPKIDRVMFGPTWRWNRVVDYRYGPHTGTVRPIETTRLWQVDLQWTRIASYKADAFLFVRRLQAAIRKTTILRSHPIVFGGTKNIVDMQPWGRAVLANVGQNEKALAIYFQLRTIFSRRARTSPNNDKQIVPAGSLLYLIGCQILLLSRKEGFISPVVALFPGRRQFIN
jgi:hypothetical protein